MTVMKLFVLVVSILSTKHGINRGGYDSIKMGMTENQVIATLIASPGDYRLVPDKKDQIQDLQWGVFILGKGFSGPDSRSWISDFGEIYVRLSDDGKVTAKMMVPSPLGGFSPYFRFLPWAYMSLRALQVLPDKERN